MKNFRIPKIISISCHSTRTMAAKKAKKSKAKPKKK
ncbi:exported protein of unknown function [Nitrososphaera viennensis EN76]|uniref:Uncharacterized protein n=1 Tax=Nitrososphaera viennensis EN76 TaxID=926571 RepID=A0A060HQ97_9ARCH|nr:exported protein of unknown function [Nitrososphaera viennensis EN76]